MAKKGKTPQPDIAFDISQQALAADSVPEPERERNLARYKNMKLEDALQDLLPDGQLIAANADLLEHPDQKVRLRALELAYKVKGLLKEDQVNVIQMMAGQLANKTPDEIDAEIKRT